MTSRKTDTLEWLYRKRIINKKQRDKGIKECAREAERKNEEWCVKKCLKVLAQGTFCCPCAGFFFTAEDDPCKKWFCATSLSGVLYGGITTLLSSGAVFKRCALGLQVGIPILVVGSLCAIGLCTCKIEMCECCDDEDSNKDNNCEQYETSSAAPLVPVTSQPRRNTTHPDNSDAGSEDDML